MPKAGIASTGTMLALIAIGATLATKDNCVIVKGVGVAPGCAYKAALKPGRTLFGKAILGIL
jgi:hypothetical protein